MHALQHYSPVETLEEDETGRSPVVRLLLATGRPANSQELPTDRARLADCVPNVTHPGSETGMIAKGKLRPRRWINERDGLREGVGIR